MFFLKAFLWIRALSSDWLSFVSSGAAQLKPSRPRLLFGFLDSNVRTVKREGLALFLSFT